MWQIVRMSKKKTNDKESIEPELLREDDGADAGSELILSRDTYPSQLPVVPIDTRPLFPRMTLPMIVTDGYLLKLFSDLAEASQHYVGLILRKTPKEESDEDAPVQPDDLYRVGVIARVLRIHRPVQQGPIQVILETKERLRVQRYVKNEPYPVAEVDYLMDTDSSMNEELKAFSISVLKSLNELVQLNPLHKEELNLLISSQGNPNEPGRLADIAAALTTADGKALQDILETTSIRMRLQKVLLLLRKEIEVSQLQVKINQQIEQKISKQQRDFFLKEQLKAIKKELGLAKEDKETEVEAFEKRLKKLKPSDEARARIDEELGKLKLLEPVSPEFHVTRNYLDWLTSLPWGVYTDENQSIDKAQEILDKDHYGLEDVKERILEFLAVTILKGEVSGSILCFVGPPGVGKTSIGQSIARSMGRKFYRFSVGGMRDEAEIKGHRRTYIGAMPGKFLQAMKTTGVANPVIMLDEIDKVGASFRGDPASALLEVLDPEQNRDFLDHYLDVRFDLSNVFFICTANQLDTIPRPLLDRMEVIHLAGYILEEKLEIARRYLIPKQLKAHGLKRAQVKIGKRALRRIIDGYAREPGVRGLENQIKKIMRKAGRRVVETSDAVLNADREELADLLGQPSFHEQDLYRRMIPGVVRGLAWTSMGGDTLFVEASRVQTGKPGFKQTGQLGKVMVESSEIAYTFVRSLLSSDDQAIEFFKKNFLHLHVPAGATPKDGPSAGITMATALYSLVRQKPVRHQLAMTGELSLTGQVMPVGGIKEKTIAAKRAKVKHMVLPERNRKQFEELPDHVKAGITPHFVSTFADVLEVCFTR